MSIKNIALFLFLALPMGAQAQELSIADANQAVIDSCGANGGKMTKFSAGKCDFQRCVYSDNKSDGTFYRAGDNQKSNCTDSELQKELQKIKDDLGIDLDNNGGSGRGSRNGRDGDGDGGDGRGGRDGRDGDRAGGSGDSGDMAIVCDFGSVNLKLPPGDKCYKKCTKKVNGVRVADTGSRSCRKCIEKYHRNADGSPIVFTTDVRGTVTLPDVQVRTGEIICRDIKTGRQVTVVGTKCQPGQVIVTSGGASAGGSSGGVIVVNGGTSGSSSSSANLPAFCLSDKKSDKKKCAEYLARQDRFRCASGSDTAGCIRDIDVIRSRYSSDCVDCDNKRRGGGSSFAEILGAALPPLAMLGGAYFNSRAQIKSNQAWAGAAAVGFEQCQLNNNNYLQYISANELPGLTPEQQRMMGCNGFGLGQFAGMGGAFGNYYGAGYSPGFVGGMMGPYGAYNPYGGMGGMVGGAVGGYVGGMQGGMYGGYMGGYSGGAGMIGGGLIGGGAIGGLVQGGYAVAGMNGGYMGGMAAGYPAGGYMAGGYMAGGMAAGYPAGGYMAGGMAAGYPAGGGIGGLVQGGYAISGMNGGMAAGYPAGGYGIGGMAAGYPAGGMYAAGGMAAGYPAGGYAPGGFAGGLVQGGYAISGMGGGYPGGGLGGYPGMGGGLGGWGSGAGGYGYNPYGYGAGYGYGSAYGAQASMQASSMDAMLQQRGISYQMGMLGSGSMGAGGMTQAYGGYAGYSPMNMGYGMGYGMGGYGYMGM